MYYLEMMTSHPLKSIMGNPNLIAFICMGKSLLEYKGLNIARSVHEILVKFCIDDQISLSAPTK